MLKTALLALVATGTLAAGLTVQSSQSASTALYGKQAIRATVSVQMLGGEATQFTLDLSKPGSAKIDSPTMLEVTDGTTMTVLDKKANTYTKSDFSEPALAGWLLKPESYFWDAFFQKDPAKLIATETGAKSRKVRGVDVNAVTVTLPNKATAELYIDPKLGVVRGYTYSSDGKQWIVWATKIETADKPLDQGMFAFVAPDGATEAKPMADAGWDSVAGIFKANCMPCHGAPAKARLDFRAYETTVPNRSIKAGDSANSQLVKSIKGTGGKSMPPGGPQLSDADIAKIVAWIDAGAKK